jgi:serine/threonine-protein kinase
MIPAADSFSARYRLGTVISGKYRLERLLSSGGMGMVYAASHLSLDRQVALKFIRPELLGSERAVERFRREALVAASVRAPQLVAVHDFDRTENDDPYIVMELLEGEDLASTIGNGPFPPGPAVAIIREVCRGLGVVHAAGLVHRDIKPRNIFLGRAAREAGAVKLLDFGLAKQVVRDEHDSLTANGGVVGTAHYMSPEQARGEAEIDARTDVYALGAVLHEMLSGQKAHPGDSYNLVVFHILSEDPTPLEVLDDRLPPSLCALVRRALSREKAARYSDARELGRALDAIAVADPGETQSSDFRPTSIPAVGVGPQSGARRIARPATAMLLICLGAGAGVWWRARQRDEFSAALPSQVSAQDVRGAPLVTPPADPAPIRPAEPPPSATPAPKPRSVHKKRPATPRPAPVATSDTAPGTPVPAAEAEVNTALPFPGPALDLDRRNPYR